MTVGLYCGPDEGSQLCPAKSDAFRTLWCYSLVGYLGEMTTFMLRRRIETFIRAEGGCHKLKDQSAGRQKPEYRGVLVRDC